MNKHSDIKQLTTKKIETIKILIHKKVEILFKPICKTGAASRIYEMKNFWKIFKFLVFLTAAVKKLDVENLRIIVQMVWKIY